MVCGCGCICDDAGNDDGNECDSVVVVVVVLKMRNNSATNALSDTSGSDSSRFHEGNCVTLRRSHTVVGTDTNVDIVS